MFQRDLFVVPRKPRALWEKIVLGYWTVNSLSIFVLWTTAFVTGSEWKDGLFAYQNGNIPIFHLTAECLMAVTTLAGLVAWNGGRDWGPLLALVGAGMFGYSAVNSMGWALHNDRTLAVPMTLTLVGLPPLLALAVKGRRTGAS